MTRTIQIAGIVVALVAAFAAGLFINRSSDRQQSNALSERRVLYWHDPMHPEYKSDKPGIAPDCGMQLEPVYADGSPDAAPKPDLPRGTVRVSLEKQQLIGVRTDRAEQSSGLQTVRTSGRVSADERNIYRINTSASGWIRNTFGNSVGSTVRKDEPLCSFYVREALTSQQSYFYALDAVDRFKSTGAPESQMVGARAQVQLASDTLEALGMSRTQLAELAKTRVPTQEITLRSPSDGIVLARNVSPGQRFEVGAPLYVVANLGHVWVLADIFQYEANYIRAGQRARITLPHQGRTFEGRVSEVLPQFDPTTRTLKVRLEVENPGYRLRPDMFVDVEFPLNVPAALTVPSDAVLDSGLRKTVFVDLGDGYFVPRRVETGWRFGDRVQIISGLMPGERVVTSGNFLIDSESRLQAAAAGIRGDPDRDVVCGMEVDPTRAKAAHRTSDHNGKTYYFCSDNCKKTFDADPDKYAAKK